MALQEALRREVARRIDAGELTGMELARKTGFTQAHISNFLNRKRGLKLRALDRMLRALGLTLYDLLDPRELARHAALPVPARREEFIGVPLVKPAAARKPVITRSDILQVLHYRRAFLDRLPAAPASPARRAWTRFVAFQLDRTEARAMWPASAGHLTLLLDRHYNTVRATRDTTRHLFAVWHRNRILVRFVSRVSSGILLRPRNPDVETELVPLPAGTHWADVILGRIAQISEKL